MKCQRNAEKYRKNVKQLLFISYNRALGTSAFVIVICSFKTHTIGGFSLNRTIDILHKVLSKMVLVKGYFCATLLLIMTTIIFVQVIMRYVFNSPFTGVEEAALLMLVWFGYLCMSIGVYNDTHVSLGFVYNKMPPIVKKLLDLFRHVLLAWFFVAMLRYGSRIVDMTMANRLPATGVPQGWLFAPLVVGGSFMILYSVVGFVTDLIKPLGAYKSNDIPQKAPVNRDAAENNNDGESTV